MLDQRLENVEYLNKKFSKFPAFEILPPLTDGSVNTYYVYPIKFNKEIAGFGRDIFIEALKAELPSAVLRETAPLVGAGYVKPLYLQPIYQKRAAWAYDPKLYDGQVKYEAGICPIAEKMHFDVLFTHEYMRPGMTKKDMKDVIHAMEKIFSNSKELVGQH